MTAKEEENHEKSMTSTSEGEQLKSEAIASAKISPVIRSSSDENIFFSQIILKIVQNDDKNDNNIIRRVKYVEC